MVGQEMREVVEVIPAPLALPVMSGAGSSYAGICICRASAGGRLEVSVLSTPPGISAEVTPLAEGEDTRAVRVTVDPARIKADAGVTEHLLILKATCSVEILASGGHKAAG